MTAVTFVILALAAYRLTHLVVFDKIFEPIRNIFVKREVAFDQSGNPFFTFTLQSGRIRKTIGKIMNCPWCASIYISALVSLTEAFHTPMQWVYITCALSGLVGLLETFWMRVVGMPEMREKK